MGMWNFLYAHSIVMKYMDFFAEGKNEVFYKMLKKNNSRTSLFPVLYPTDALELSIDNDPLWIDRLLAASKLFYAHSIYWNTYTDEELGRYRFILMNYNSFIPARMFSVALDAYSVVNNSEKAAFGKNRNKMSMQEAKEIAWWFDGYIKQDTRMADYNHYCEIMIDALKESEEEFERISINGSNKTKREVYEWYVRKAYESIDMGPRFDDSYYNYFYPLKTMRGLLNDYEVRSNYIEYKNYLLCHER